MTALWKPKEETLATQSGTAGMEQVLAHIQLAIGELNEAGRFFERLGLDSQKAQIDSALEEIEEVEVIMQALLGRV